MPDWTPQLVHAETDYALGHNGPIFAVIWRRDTTVAGARHLNSSFHEWADDGTPRGLVTIIEADAPLPETDAREMVATFLKSISDKAVVSAVIFEGAGFKSAAVRGVVTGLTMLARQSYPHRVFATVEEAGPWYCERAPAEWELTAEGFERAVAEIRALIPH